MFMNVCLIMFLFICCNTNTVQHNDHNKSTDISFVSETQLFQSVLKILCYSLMLCNQNITLEWTSVMCYILQFGIFFFFVVYLFVCLFVCVSFFNSVNFHLDQTTTRWVSKHFHAHLFASEYISHQTSNNDCISSLIHLSSVYYKSHPYIYHTWLQS